MSAKLEHVVAVHLLQGVLRCKLDLFWCQHVGDWRGEVPQIHRAELKFVQRIRKILGLEMLRNVAEPSVFHWLERPALRLP